MSAIKKKARSENWLEEDKHLLLELVQERVRIIENKNTDTNTNNQKKTCWDSLLDSFNAMCNGKPRTVAQLKTQWSSLKLLAKKEVATERRELIKTGGGPQPPIGKTYYKYISAWLPNEFVVDKNEFDSDTTNIKKILEKETTNEAESVSAEPVETIHHDSSTINTNKIVKKETSRLADVSLETVQDMHNEVTSDVEVTKVKRKLDIDNTCSTNKTKKTRSKKLKDYVKVNNPNVKHGLMDQASTSIDVTNHYSNFLDIPAEAMFSKVSLLDKNEFVNNDFSCSKRILNVEMEIDNITDASHSSSLSETVDKGLADNESTDSIPNISSYGRRIFDVDYLFSQLFSKAKHEPFNCTFSDMYVINERRKGLKSIFTLKCRMCGLKDTLQTEPEDPSILDTLNINTAATLACISTGIGYSEFEEFAASINMPMMSATTYANCEAHLASFIRDAAWKTMEETGQEEAKLAKDLVNS
ncbi:hypothetical protein RN001_008645 [Aquatica leii]|uniref:Regulatory protein zeste n=1 Tax=Aquatica leii TaxID=1421715 RepID=A0AAN7SHC5_9COLE|nr:hypothetical protein RN001_008645 [Aquatica leii]